MGKFIDLTGQRFGRLTVVERAGNDKSGHPQWLCRCDCENITIVGGTQLRSGNTKSCGCLSRETSAQNIISINQTHGQSNTRLYYIWRSMKQRCMCPTCKSYKDYGGRGITVCEEWQQFEPFYEWAMQNGYRNDLSIDRIDNDKGYSPENCRWSTGREQSNNKRNNYTITCNRQTKTISQWSREIGIPKDTIRKRLVNLGWSVEKALTTPIDTPKRHKK